MLLCLLGDGSTGAILSGFPDNLDLNSTSVTVASSVNGSTVHWIFPSMRILCNGTITTLRFNGVYSTISGSASYPSLTTWTDNTFSTNYELQAERPLSNSIPVETIAAHSIFVATFDPPLNVTADCFVGLKYPGGSAGITVQPLFLDLGQGNANESFYVTFPTITVPQSSPRYDQYIPLIIPEVISKLYSISVMLMWLCTSKIRQ